MKIYSIARWFRNKYILVLIVFLIWMVLFDQNSFVNQYGYYKEMKKMEQKNAYLDSQIENSKANVKRLEQNKQELEKFAREKYYMKKPDEDIFILLPDSHLSDSNHKLIQ